MIADDVLDALLGVVSALEALGVAYHLGGSVASSIHGLPRTTADVDIVADLGQEHARRLVDSLTAAYYIDADAVQTAVQQRASFNVIHLQTMIKVNVFVSDHGEFDRRVLKRAKIESLDEKGEQRVYVKSPEDIVLQKLRWYRDGGEVSERQWGDVLGVLKVQATGLDGAYLRQWAAHLLVTDLLGRALEEAGLAL